MKLSNFRQVIAKDVAARPTLTADVAGLKLDKAKIKANLGIE